MHHRVRFTSAALLLLLGGCKCSPGGSTADGGNLGPLRDVLGGLCNYLSRCPGQTDYPIAYRSRSECVDILQFLLTCHLTTAQDPAGQTVVGVQQGVPSIDPAQAQACLDWLNQASCGALSACASDGGCSPCSFLGSSSGPTKGGAPPPGLDQRCDNATCASGLYCEGATAVDGGQTCQVCKPLRGFGGDCFDPPYVQCAPGLFCPTDAGGCTSVLAAGVSCSNWNQCDSGFCNPNTSACDVGGLPGEACRNAQDCRQGFCDPSSSTCSDLLTNGSPCSANDQCRNGACDPGTGLCGKPDGASCFSDGDCQSGYCNTGASSGSVCAPQLGLGQPCTSRDQCDSGWCDLFGSRTCVQGCYTDSDCASGQFCDSSSETCVPRQPNGGGCQDGTQCQSGFCSAAGSCGTKPGLGGACTDTSDCMPTGYCAGGICKVLVQPDQPCTQLDACAPPFICLTGTCKLMPLTCAPAAIGSTCTYLAVCDDSSYCDPLNQFTCEPREDAGASCNRDDQCSSGLYCGQRTCRPYGQAGTSCDDLDPCAPGLFCDVTQGVCADPKPAGAACGQGSECDSGVCNWGSTGQICQAACIPPAPGDVPACHPKACPSGQNCGTIDDGCGNQVSCGTCSSAYESCGGGGTAGVCGCTPDAGCLPRQCAGYVDDGCGHQVFCDAGCPTGATCGGGSGAGAPICGCAPSDSVGGPLLATSGANWLPPGSSGFTAWDNLSLVGAQDAGAHVGLNPPPGFGVESQYLYASGFGFQLPATAMVNGITVSMDRYATSSSVFDVQVGLMSGGRILASGTGGSWSTSWTPATFGSSSDLWGYPWTADQLNAPDFGVVLMVEATAPADVYVGNVQVTLAYVANCACIKQCRPGAQCGSDGCGGTCGTGCAAGQSCDFDRCISPIWTDPDSGLSWQNNLVTFTSDCRVSDAGGFTDWHAPTIDQLRTLVRGCPATEAGGSCGVTNACNDAGCDDPSCAGCSFAQGPGPSGCYLPDGLASAYCNSSWPIVSTTPSPSGAWQINFEYGELIDGCGGPPYCPYIETACVRP